MKNSVDQRQGSAAYQYVSKRWGVPIRLVPKVIIAVNPGPVRILVPNPRRFQWLIVNLGVNQIFIDWAPSTSTQGLTIPASNGTLTSLVDEDGELTTYDVWAYDPNSGNNVAVWEIIEV